VSDTTQDDGSNEDDCKIINLLLNQPKFMYSFQTKKAAQKIDNLLNFRII
jgi:hypothetical protein